MEDNSKSENETESLDSDINIIPSVSDLHDSSSSWDSLDAKTQDIDNDSSDEKKKEVSDEWEDILGSGALFRKVIREGEPNTKPRRLTICTVNYKCTLDDGNCTLVEEKENFKIYQGDLEITQAIDITLSLMNIGEKCIIKVEPRLGYGVKGNPPLIPPDAKLIYEIELLDVEEEKEDYSVSERKKIGNDKKQRGNFWYGRGEYTFAIQCYRRALDYLDEVEGGITGALSENDSAKETTSDAELQDILEDRLSVHNNLAAAQMKQGAMDAALQSLQNVLRCQPNNVKALYRKSMVLKEKNDINEALKCLQKAKSLEPDNTSILKEIKSVQGLLQKQKNYEKELAKRMFSSSTDTSKKSQNKEVRKSSPLFWASLVGSVAVGIAGIAAWRFKFA